VQVVKELFPPTAIRTSSLIKVEQDRRRPMPRCHNGIQIVLLTAGSKASTTPRFNFTTPPSAVFDRPTVYKKK